MKKIVSVIGARPQLIKTALLSKELRRYFKEIIIHTGQHYDPNLSAIFYQDLDLAKVGYNLEVGSASQGAQTAMMLERIEKVLIKEKPDLTLIYGDTNSTIAAALASAKLHIPVAHIEAGMRSFNRSMPEEINRIVADHLSDLLFCSTLQATELLKREGITKGVYFTGDVMYDLQKNLIISEQQKTLILKKLSLKPKEYFLLTVHRQENTDNRENLKNIFQALSQISKTIIFPIHPRTKRFIKEYEMEEMVSKIKNLKIIDPVPYSDTLILEQNAQLILTDSGGVQKEAYIAEVPCLTLRNETEWQETVDSGWNQLVGADIRKIINLSQNFPKPKSHPDFLGDGTAYIKTVNIIKEYLKK